MNHAVRTHAKSRICISVNSQWEASPKWDDRLMSRLPCLVHLQGPSGSVIHQTQPVAGPGHLYLDVPAHPRRRLVETRADYICAYNSHELQCVSIDMGRSSQPGFGFAHNPMQEAMMPLPRDGSSWVRAWELGELGGLGAWVNCFDLDGTSWSIE